MPAAVPLAIVGASVVGAAATSSANKKTTAAAERTADTNNALQRDIYNQNRQTLQPYVDGGNKSFSAWQDFMGLNATAPAPASAPVGGQAKAAAAQAQIQPGQPQVLPDEDAGGYPTGVLSGSPFVRPEYETERMPGVRESRWEAGNALQIPPKQNYVGGLENPTGQPQAPMTNALTGYDMFKASTGYQTGLNEGNRSLTAAQASQGRLMSGDAYREAIRYNQSYADTFAGNYLDRLMGGAQLGASSGNALAGVGSNYAGAVSANNNTSLNAIAGANSSNADAISGLAGNAAAAAGYYYGNRDTPSALASSYTPRASIYPWG